MGDTRSEIRKRIDEAKDHAQARHFREFYMQPGGRDRAVNSMVKELSEHLSQRNDREFLKPTTGVIVAENRKEARRINLAVRDELRTRGVLSPANERYVTTLRSLNWTDEQKRNPESYKRDAANMIIKFNRHVGDFSKGERVSLQGEFYHKHGDQKRYMMTKRENGDYRPLPLDRPSTFNLYNEGKIRVAPGEQIRVTENGESLVWDKAMISNIHRTTKDLHHFRKGEHYRVYGFAPDGYLNLGGKQVSNFYGHYEYAYAATPDQLPTCEIDKLYVHGDKSLSNPRVQEAMEQAKDTVKVYHDHQPDKSKAKSKDKEVGFDRGIEMEL